jgi:hypothetical protein
MLKCITREIVYSFFKTMSWIALIKASNRIFEFHLTISRMKKDIPGISIYFLSFLLLWVSACSTGGQNNKGQDEKNIAPLDSTTITRWDILPNGNQALCYTVFKDSGIYWKVKMPDNKIADADLKTVTRGLRHLSKFAGMAPVNLDKSKWDAEGINDKGNKVIVYTNNIKAESFFISKLEFLNGNKSSYYLRRPGSDKVFIIKGVYLEGSVIAPAENFRKRIMVPVDLKYFKTIKIVTPGSNEYYLIEKVHDTWTINGQNAIQDKVNMYAKMLTMIQVPQFVDHISNSKHDAFLIIYTKYGDVKLYADQNTTGDWTLGSSVNIGNYLKLNTAQVNAIFPPVTEFTKN